MLWNRPVFLTSWTKSLLIYGQTGQLWSNSATGKSFRREALVHLLLSLILDGTTGLNMLPQAGEFNEVKLKECRH
ncbi:hypothetical protein Hanom_Chr03g00231141 [Helianthus anomalus]